MRPMSPGIISTALLGAVAAAGLGWVLGVPADPPQRAPMGVVEVAAPEATIVVHVGGAVARPGLVALAEGARVADAIRAVGGMAAGASSDSVNLARILVDGEHLVVGAGAAPVGGDEERVRINSASVDELEALPGVGPVLAGRIVEHRSRVGPFTEVEDLLAVPGIGERMLESLRDRVQVP